VKTYRSHQHGLITQAEVFKIDLDHMRRRYLAGDRSKLISAVIYCGKHKLVMPDWIVEELDNITRPWFSADVKGVGEALGVQLPKGAHLNKLKQKQRYQYAVYTRVVDARRRGEPVDEQMFARIGSELGIGKTRTSEYYYSVKGPPDKDFRKK